jgi:predicted nuclease with RNAse H fold
MMIVGLDLAGVESRPTGFCSLVGLKSETSMLYADAEIIEAVRKVRPQIVAIVAPLSLPPGRKSIEERTNSHLRECDMELLRRSIKFFPITLGPMRKLTIRGMNLKKIFQAEKYAVIEVYPGGAQDVLGIPRKQKGLKKLRAGLENLGIKGLNIDMSDHELDAVTCAYVGKLYLEGTAIIYGTCNEQIVMPEDARNAH